MNMYECPYLAARYMKIRKIMFYDVATIKIVQSINYRDNKVERAIRFEQSAKHFDLV